MNKLLSVIRKPYYDEEEALDEEENDIELQINYARIKKIISSSRILNEMIQTLPPDELERQLYETDNYGCTALHYACRFHLERVALLIINHTTKEENLYKCSSIGLNPLIICCRNGKRKLHSVFEIILEKTTNEENLYLGKNHALQFCILNRDVKKAKMILDKTQNERNLYKTGIRHTSLIFALENGLLDIASLIIEKTKVEKHLWLPSPAISKNLFYYLHYNEIKKEVKEKYEKINGIYKSILNVIFVKNDNKLPELMAILCIGDFLERRIISL